MVKFLTKIKQFFKYGGIPPKDGLEQELFFLKRAYRRDKKELYWSMVDDERWRDDDSLKTWDLRQKQERRRARIAQIQRRLKAKPY